MVLVNYEHGDMDLAFRSLHASTGQRRDNVKDPTKYLLMWKAARLYVRERPPARAHARTRNVFVPASACGRLWGVASGAETQNSQNSPSLSP